jgi:hypothetical protein
MSGQRISRRELETICAGLTDRDMKIVASVAMYRLLTTRQICRLHFADKATETAALRSANRTLDKLRGLRLLVPLQRRIGGVRAGSGAYIWSLGHVGARLLQRADNVDGRPQRRREFEPSSTFLEHTLAVAEVCLRLTEAAQRGDVTLVGIQHEPTRRRRSAAQTGPCRRHRHGRVRRPLVLRGRPGDRTAFAPDPCLPELPGV